MSAIVVTDGALPSARSVAAAALAESPGGALPLDTVFVAPGDEIHVDHEGGFLKCSRALWARATARGARADGIRVATGGTARSSWTAACWQPRAAWWRA